MSVNPATSAYQNKQKYRLNHDKTKSYLSKISTK